MDQGSPGLGNDVRQIAGGRAGKLVTTSDTIDVDGVRPARWLYVGTTGNINVLLADDTSPVLLNAVPVGLYQLAVRRVYATSTTASNLVVFF